MKTLEDAIVDLKEAFVGQQEILFYLDVTKQALIEIGISGEIKEEQVLEFYFSFMRQMYTVVTKDYPEILSPEIAEEVGAALICWLSLHFHGIDHVQVYAQALANCMTQNLVSILAQYGVKGLGVAEEVDLINSDETSANDCQEALRPGEKEWIC